MVFTLNLRSQRGPKVAEVSKGGNISDIPSECLRARLPLHTAPNNHYMDLINGLVCPSYHITRKISLEGVHWPRGDQRLPLATLSGLSSHIYIP